MYGGKDAPVSSMEEMREMDSMTLASALAFYLRGAHWAGRVSIMQSQARGM